MPAPKGGLSITRQCDLAGVARSTFYGSRKKVEPRVRDRELQSKIEAQYTLHPFYGSRRMTAFLRGLGDLKNRKRVQRLMSELGLLGMAPGPNTSRRHRQHPIYPYLLRGLNVVRPNQVWGTEFTYIRLERGFVYLVAILDLYSRKVLAWRISNTLDSAFCVACPDEALQTYGKPEIFNTDQGCQFTSEVFTSVLKANGILISMDGRGRALDNTTWSVSGTASNTRIPT